MGEIFRAGLKIMWDGVIEQRVGWRSATRENTPGGSST